MTPAVFIEWASLISLILLSLALLISLVRIVIGPTLSDRVLALDMMTIVAMGFVGAVAIRSSLWLYLDIAVALALLGFLATLALAKYILYRGAANAAAREGGP